MIESSTLDPVVVGTNRPYMSWIAVFGGWTVAMGIASVMYGLGLAVGFSSFSLADTDSVAKGIGIGTTVWVILTWVASLFIGGLFAAWVDGRQDQTVGTLHGIAVWGLAMTLTVLVGAQGASGLLKGVGAVAQGAATTAAAGAGGAAAAAAGTDTPSSRATGLLGAQIKRAVTQRASSGGGAGAAGAQPAASGAGTPGAAPAGAASADTSASATSSDARGTRTLDAATTSAVAADLMRGKGDDAKARLAADAGLSPADADAVVQGVSAQVEKAKADVKDAAEQARRYTAAAMWALVLSSLLALVAGALGGWTGAGHLHRVHDHLRPI